MKVKLCKAWGWLGKWVETCRRKTNILWQLYNCKIYCCAWLYFSPILWTFLHLFLRPYFWSINSNSPHPNHCFFFFYLLRNNWNTICNVNRNDVTQTISNSWAIAISLTYFPIVDPIPCVHYKFIGPSYSYTNYCSNYRPSCLAVKVIQLIIVNAEYQL
jgi:hypothetical protein